MAQLQVNPTRMELKKIQARYTTARRGHKLLKDKRDELMKKFLEVVREDKVLRERVEAALAQFQGSFGIASATASPLMLKEALILPKKEGRLDVTYKNVMSVTVPCFSLDMLGTGGADSYNYGMYKRQPGDHQSDPHEAGRKRARQHHPPDEGQGYDAAGAAAGCSPGRGTALRRPAAGYVWGGAS